MKRLLFFMLITLGYVNYAGAQVINSFYNHLTINGIQFLSNKQTVLKNFGKPVKQFEPHYECGFLSADEQQTTFITLQYAGLKWTGSKKFGYIIDHLVVLPNSPYVLKYKGKVISAKTTWAEAMKLFGVADNGLKNGRYYKKEAKGSFQIGFSRETGIDINYSEEDKFIFYFINGKLHEIEYWSPC